MPLLTIVIPTRNHARTAIESVRTALAVEDDDLEVVVHDCSDGADLQDRLSELQADRRLVYWRIGPVSMTENWRQAVERATGDYVCFIGDDDGVTRNVMPAMRWAREQGFQAVVDARASYCWPDYPVHRVAGRLVIPNVRGGFEVLNADEELDRGIACPFVDITRLPRLYHGFVRRELLERVKKQAGAFFASTSPDYYSAVALATLRPHYCFLDYPILVSGASELSNTGRAARAPKRLTAHFAEYGEIAWPDYLPRCASAYVSIAEAIALAETRMGRHDISHRLNWQAMLGVSLSQDPSRLSDFVRCVPKIANLYKMSLSPLVAGIMFYAAQHAYRRGRSKVANLLPLPPLPGPRAKSLIEAVSLVEHHMKACKVHAPWSSQDA